MSCLIFLLLLLFLYLSLLPNTPPVDQRCQQLQPPISVWGHTVSECVPVCLCACDTKPGCGETDAQSKYNSRPLRDVSSISKCGTLNLRDWLATHTLHVLCGYTSVVTCHWFAEKRFEIDTSDRVNITLVWEHLLSVAFCPPPAKRHRAA